MLKPIGILAAALIAASVTATAGTGTPDDHRAGRIEAGASAAPFAKQGSVAPAPLPHAAAPEITSISPAVLEPGMTATLQGTGFRPNSGDNLVTIDDVRVAVTSASESTLTVQLPLGGFKCRPERSVTVRAQASGTSGVIQHPLRAARAVRLDPGQVATPADLRLGHCIELAATGGEYLIGVVNAIPDGTRRSYSLHGEVGTAAEPVAPVDPVPTPGTPQELRPDEAEAAATTLDSARNAGERHLEHLERQRERLRRITVSPRAATGRRPASLPVKAVPREGDVEPMRVQDVWDSCRTADTISARVVFVGDHSIIMEDVAAPLAGQMDDDYRAIGREFEQTMLPILLQNFGNPIALDTILDGDGRLRMLFTPRVTDLDSSAYGFVTSCDFEEPEAEFASSNTGEVFYAAVPASHAARRRWLRDAGATVIHEVKHLVSYAVRIEKRAEGEHAWMEEATAMAAEELYARTFSGAAQRGNARYDVVKCEFGLPDPSCEEVPLSMGLHLNHLFNDFINADKTETVFHRGYGAGWSFVRWAADASPEEEADFFSSLVSNAGQYPGENLARLLRRPLPDLVVDWLVAFATDDYPDFSPAREVHSLASWDMRQIYGTLHQAGVEPYNLRRYPLDVKEDGRFGAFRIDVSRLPSAAGSFVRLSGAQSSTQLLWLTSPGNRPLRDDTGLRLTVVRLR